MAFCVVGAAELRTKPRRFGIRNGIKVSRFRFKTSGVAYQECLCKGLHIFGELYGDEDCRKPLSRLASYLLEDHVTTRVSLGKASEIIDLNVTYRQ